MSCGWRMPMTRRALRARSRSFAPPKIRPTLIIVDSIIGYGAPHKQNTAAAHSDALGAEEVKLAKRFYGWPEDAQFLVPDGVYETFRDGVGRRGRAGRDDWIKTLRSLQERARGGGAGSGNAVARQIAGTMGSRAADVSGREGSRSRRPRHALWCARTRHGRHRQRAGAVKTARLRRDLSHLQRLYAPRDPARCADGNTGLPRLHP